MRKPKYVATCLVLTFVVACGKTSGSAANRSIDSASSGAGAGGAGSGSGGSSGQSSQAGYAGLAGIPLHRVLPDGGSVPLSSGGAPSEVAIGPPAAGNRPAPLPCSSSRVPLPGPGTACTTDERCPSGQLCYCNPENTPGICTVADCRVDADCAPGECMQTGAITGTDCSTRSFEYHCQRTKDECTFGTDCPTPKECLFQRTVGHRVCQESSCGL
jgi:hypothetical protein